MSCCTGRRYSGFGDAVMIDGRAFFEAEAKRLEAEARRQIEAQLHPAQPVQSDHTGLVLGGLAAIAALWAIS